MDCPFFWECQEYALEEGIPYGVWGGLDEKQREHIWQGRKGGKPNKFLNDIDEALRPLLQDRRDRENDLSTRTTESRGHSPEASNDKRNEEDVA